MRKYFSGAVAAGLVVTGSLAWAGPGAAQAPPVTELEATLEVDGTFISVTSVDSCSTPEQTFSFVQWGIFEGSDPSWEDILAGNVPAIEEGFIETEDGSWSLEGDFGELGEGPEVAAAAAEAEAAQEPGGTEVYGPLPFTIEETDYSLAAFCSTLLTAEFTSHETVYEPGGPPVGFAAVDPGDEVTVGPLSICPAPTTEGEFLHYVAYVADAEAPIVEDAVPLHDDGSWDDIAFTAPNEQVFGFVELACETAAGDVTADYIPLMFEVGEAGEPPTTPPTKPTGPPPATPIDDDPPFTG